MNMAKINNKFYLFANWKMYLDFKQSVTLAKSLAKNKNFKNFEMCIFPSALSFEKVASVISKTHIKVGAQNVYSEDKGGFTGEVSVYDFKNVGAEYALIGHSERRHLFHETNQEIRKKISGCVSSGIIPVLCVGETSKEKEERQTKDVIFAQLESAFGEMNGKSAKKAVIAYEPVWAIGTGKNCAPNDAENILDFICKYAAKLLPQAEVVLLYGGSVKAENVAEFLSKEHINGVLVGGASAKLDSLVKIAQNVVV
jgi:triosephosphate isomerase